MSTNYNTFAVTNLIQLNIAIALFSGNVHHLFEIKHVSKIRYGIYGILSEY